MKLIHQQWQLVGSVLIVDDEGNAVPLGTNEQGQTVKSLNINVPVERFRRNEFERAYGQARVACEKLLEQVAQQQGPTGVLDETSENQIEDSESESVC